MELPGDLALIHQPVRLRIMAALRRHRDIGFAELRDALALTDGNLASHAKRLEEAELLVSRRSLASSGVAVRYTITPHGDARLDAYVAWLRLALDDLG